MAATWFVRGLTITFLLYVVVLILNFSRLFYPDHQGTDISAPNTIASLWTSSTPIDMHIFVTTAQQPPSPTRQLKPKVVAHALNTTVATADDVLYTTTVNISRPSDAKKSAYAHIVMGVENEFGTMRDVAVEMTVPLTTQRRISSNSTRYPHMLKTLSVCIVRDHYNFTRRSVPEDLLGHLRVHQRGDKGGVLYYMPLVVVIEELWGSQHDYLLLNDTITRTSLNVTVVTCSLGWYRLTMQMQLAFSMLSGVVDEVELDGLKYSFLRTNPKLMLLTLVVSLLHTFFDVLAFKSDINYWQGRKRFGGISRRSMLVSTFCQIVILLYLFDNNTSMLIMASSIVSLLISLWKLTKLFHWRGGFSLKTDELSMLERRTKGYDEEISAYITYALVPLMIGGCVYTYVFHDNTNKRLYSWLLDSFARGVYMFGFLLMLPQLYVNYKLKSVAHLNWSRLMYAALNTFIDDLFAFIIVMPDLHFWSVFRDDVVFLIFLYQRCIYRSRPPPVDDDDGTSGDGGDGDKRKTD